VQGIDVSVEPRRNRAPPRLQPHLAVTVVLPEPPREYLPLPRDEDEPVDHLTITRDHRSLASVAVPRRAAAELELR
jgi:hypothetical protein